MDHQMEYVRTTYGVPAERGMRVEYLATEPPIEGTIVGAKHGRLQIRMDNSKQARPFHPTWKLSYRVPNVEANRGGDDGK